MQDAVTSAGPLVALLGFLILPFVWSVPEALVTAELATAFPEDSGCVPSILQVKIYNSASQIFAPSDLLLVKTFDSRPAHPLFRWQKYSFEFIRASESLGGECSLV